MKEERKEKGKKMKMGQWEMERLEWLLREVGSLRS